MAERYFYSVNGGEGQGPVPLETLRQLYRDGVLTASSYICVEGATTWQPVDPALLQPPAALPPSFVPPVPPSPPLPQVPVKSTGVGLLAIILNIFAVIIAICGAAILAIITPSDSSDPSGAIGYRVGAFWGALIVIGLVPHVISRFIKGNAKAPVRLILILGFAMTSIGGQFARFASDAKLEGDVKATSAKLKEEARQQLATKGYIESNPEQAQKTLQKLSNQASGDSDLARCTRDLLGVMKDMLAKVKVSTDAENACKFEVGTITGPDDIAQRRAQLGKLHDAQSDVIAYLQGFDTHCRDALAKDNFSSDFVNGAVTGARKSGHIDLLITLWQTNSKLTDDYVTILDYLTKTHDKWSPKNGKIIFSDDASLAGYQDIAKQLKSDAKQVGELQKQLVQ